jgi:hypothetical protein
VLSSVSQVFDEPNLVSHGGLLTAGVLAERIGLWSLVASTLTVPGPNGVNSAAKVASVVGGMLAGADSIDDLDVLRSGASPELFDQVRAPSTVGSWLRAFGHGNVRQLGAVSRELRVRLWDAGAGPHRLDVRLFIDADSTIARAYGPAKQGVSFGCTKVRGYHPLIATVLEPGGTPDVLHTRGAGGAGQHRPRRRGLHRRGDRPGPGGRVHRGAGGPRRRRLLQRQAHRGRGLIRAWRHGRPRRLVPIMTARRRRDRHFARCGWTVWMTTARRSRRASSGPSGNSWQHGVVAQKRAGL